MGFFVIGNRLRSSRLYYPDSDSTVKCNEQNTMIPAKTDPQVSCPIVCGECIRATGFFLKDHSQTFLVTARHNLLPVKAAETDGDQLSYHTRNLLPTVDIYLRNGAAFTVKRVTLSEKEGVLIGTDIDLIGVPIDIDPETYGYIPWSLTDITPPDATPTTLDVIGYPSQAFPDGTEYNTETHAEEITDPYVLNLSTDFQTDSRAPTQTGFLDISIDTGQKQHHPDYEGYSGCPVVGDGLVGIYCTNCLVTTVNTDTDEQTERTGIAYWHADTLKRLFNTKHRS